MNDADVFSVGLVNRPMDLFELTLGGGPGGFDKSPGGYVKTNPFTLSQASFSFAEIHAVSPAPAEKPPIVRLLKS